MFFAQPSTIAVKIHPQTTDIISNTTNQQHLLLVGYISIEVTKPTAIESLHIRLTGQQQLELRQGEGPSSTLHAISNKCADIHQTLFSPPVDSRILEEGTYKYPFELSVPGNLPPSVESPLGGGVSYRLAADVKRPAGSAWMLQRPIYALDVPISVVQSQATSNNTLLFQTAADNDWDISVYGSSGVLVPGVPTRLQAFATPSRTASDNASRVELKGFAVTLSELITHRVPSKALEQITRRRVAVAASNHRKLSAKEEFIMPSCHSIDPLTVDALGDTFADMLPPVGALTLNLGKVQPDSGSANFVVAHKLQISVTIRMTKGGSVRDRRLSFSAPVPVLPSTILTDSMASLPHYGDISGDTMLMSSSICSPPAYSN